MSEKQPSEIEALTAELAAISIKEKTAAKPVLKALLSIVNDGNEPIELVHKVLCEVLFAMFSEVQLIQNLAKLTVTDTTSSNLTQIFGLEFNHDNDHRRWILASEDVEIPVMLIQTLRDLHYALDRDEEEATCRIAIDLILVECCKHLRQKHETPAKTPDANATDPATPPKHVKHVTPFPKPLIKMRLQDGVLVTSCRDESPAYILRRVEHILFVAVEAKERSAFSAGEVQLISYLAILQKTRLRQKKTNITTQGFCSDGTNFRFVRLTPDGTVQRSKFFDIDYDLKTIFNFIITMMETAMESIPGTTLTKPSQARETEINCSKEEVSSKVYATKDSDDGMEDAEACTKVYATKDSDDGMEDAEAWTKVNAPKGSDDGMEDA